MNILRKCVELTEQGNNIALLTVLKTDASTPGKEGFKMIVTEAGERYGTVGGGELELYTVKQAHEVLADGENRVLDLDLDELGMECGGSIVISIEYMQGSLFFVLFGGGHVGSALAPIVQSIGFTVVVFDNREEILRYHKEKGRITLDGDFSDISAADRFLQSGYCCIATKGHYYDTTILKQILKKETAFSYIGMIGSKRKARTAREECEKDGLSIPPALYAPVGLPVGGDTVSEIAVSIASEVLAVKYGKDVPHMRDGI